MASDLSEALELFPPVEHAFAYGSGVFPQEGAPKTDAPTMLDYILVVNGATGWHEENLQRNPSHYAGPLGRYFGAKGITYVADEYGVGVHFNAYVPWGDRVIKYGVIERAALVEDLYYWSSLYVAGRMHKPVRTLLADAAVEQAADHNTRAALACALLLLPDRFSEAELHAAVCGLSYAGDVRMRFAEDAGKVERIAASSAAGLGALYGPLLASSNTAARASLVQTARGPVPAWQQDKSEAARTEMMSSLPTELLNAMAMSAPHLRCRPMETDDDAEAAWEIAHAAANSRAGWFNGGTDRDIIRQGLARIVGRSSRRQAASGLLSAGASNAMRYVRAKMKKAWKSR